MSKPVDLLAPGVLEAGLLSITECPVCSENLRAAFNRGDLLFPGSVPPWAPKSCPNHPGAKWGADAS